MISAKNMFTTMFTYFVALLTHSTHKHTTPIDFYNAPKHVCSSASHNELREIPSKMPMFPYLETLPT